MDKIKIPKTVVELEQWMKIHCYKFNSYSINGNAIYEGNGLEFYKGAYQWYYVERSYKKILKRFKKEAQAVLYAFEKITSDIWANKNLVGIFKLDELNSILEILKKRSIAYNTDQIPFGENDWRTRVFVTGCDIKNVTDLIQNKYKDL